MQVTADAEAFFDEFVRAFSSFDGEVIARRYAAPYMAMHSGTDVVYSCASDTARYFQAIVDGYGERGARTCCYQDLEVVAVGRSHLLASVTWELHDQAGSAISAWRESYTLALRDGQYQITSSIDH